MTVTLFPKPWWLRLELVKHRETWQLASFVERYPQQVLKGYVRQWITSPFNPTEGGMKSVRQGSGVLSGRNSSRAETCWQVGTCPTILTLLVGFFFNTRASRWRRSKNSRRWSWVKVMYNYYSTQFLMTRSLDPWDVRLRLLPSLKSRYDCKHHKTTVSQVVVRFHFFIPFTTCWDHTVLLTSWSLFKNPPKVTTGGTSSFTRPWIPSTECVWNGLFNRETRD
jgi:hypothetical protein